MKESKIDHITRLLGHLAAGQITVQERAELQEWSAGGARATALLEKIEAGDNIAPQDVERFEKGADTAMAWSELRGRIASQHRRRQLTRAASWSAAAMIVAAAAFFVARPRETLRQEIYAPLSTVVLELPGGQSVELGNTQELAQYGARRDGRNLAYSGADTLAATPQRLRVGRGGDFVLDLPDGTRVWVNSLSTVSYPSRFDGEQRRVEVSGEAYFEVVRDGRPFTVHAGGMDVRVTGTQFNVMAYPGAPTVEVTLVQGGVSTRTPSASLDLVPGERAVYTLADHSLNAGKVDVALHTSWREGVFEFRAMPLSQIIPQLERWYDVEVVLSDAQIGAIRLTGAVKKGNSLNHMLDILADLKQLDYTVQERIVTIKHRN